MNGEATKRKGAGTAVEKKNFLSYCMELKADEIWTVSDVSLSVSHVLSAKEPN